jgi:hypothetical protein
MTAMHVVCQRMRAELELVAGADDDLEDDHPEQACHIRVGSGLARRVICTSGTCLAPATPGQGLRSPLPHLHRDQPRCAGGRRRRRPPHRRPLRRSPPVPLAAAACCRECPAGRRRWPAAVRANGRRLRRAQVRLVPAAGCDVAIVRGAPCRCFETLALQPHLRARRVLRSIDPGA